MSSFMSGWSFRKQGQPESLTVDQINLTIHFGAGLDTSTDVFCNGHYKPDFSDIRFTKLPSSISGAITNPSTGVFRTQWIATWNAGSIPAVTLGEVCLYLGVSGTLLAFGGTVSSGGALYSRMASADGKFASFTIDNTKAVTVTWTFQLTYVT